LGAKTVAKYRNWGSWHVSEQTSKIDNLGQPDFVGCSEFDILAWFIIIQNDLYNFSVKRHPSNVKKSLFATL